MHRPSFLAASFLLSGAVAAQADFIPTTPDVLLDTTNNNGVYVYRDIIVNQGINVRGIGDKPLILFATRNVVVRGTISVSGDRGESVETLLAAYFPSIGGYGGAGGGGGGFGSPSTTGPSPSGDNGTDAFGAPVGGVGGLLWNTSTTGRGSGGGGGAFATQGDPWLYPLPVSIPQVLGIGGFGGPGNSGAATRTLAGGAAGASPFVDAFEDNNFFGTAIDLHRFRIVQGELPFLRGGSGGGGGGDLVSSTSNWIGDARGGGGGGGGGCLLLFAAGYLAVLDGGSIHADGGHGGGGEQAGSSNKGGGGGGGSGGMVVLASRTAIALEVRGETFANNDYSFVVSADGGGCVSSPFLTWAPFKYPNSGLPLTANSARLYDTEPRGGYGGMGVVQLMAPWGDNADGTNTALDDSILLVRNGNLLFGAEKQRFLGWRGFQDTNGVFVDDAGVPTNIGRNAGDIRPSPVLLPLF